jgi:opacity protein-like surface antigen
MISTFKERTMRTAFAAVSALALLAAVPTSAFAADVYSSAKDPMLATAAGPAPSWSGAIVGIGLEGAFVNHDTSLNVNNATVAELNGLSGIGMGADFLVGLRYQLPQSRLVFGVEAEYAITDSPVNLNINAGSFGANPSLDLTGKWAIFGTAGVVINPNTLAYIGGGYGQAYYHSSGMIGKTISVNNAVGDPTVDGAVFKAGLEAKLPFIAQGAFIRGEYEFFDANQVTLWATPATRSTPVSITDVANINSAKLVLGYQFGGGSSPLESLK